MRVCGSEKLPAGLLKFFFRNVCKELGTVDKIGIAAVFSDKADDPLIPGEAGNKEKHLLFVSKGLGYKGKRPGKGGLDPENLGVSVGELFLKQFF